MITKSISHFICSCRSVAWSHFVKPVWSHASAIWCTELYILLLVFYCGMLTQRLLFCIPPNMVGSIKCSEYKTLNSRLLLFYWRILSSVSHTAAVVVMWHIWVLRLSGGIFSHIIILYSHSISGHFRLQFKDISHFKNCQTSDVRCSWHHKVCFLSLGVSISCTVCI